MTRVLYLHGFASSPSSSKARYFHTLLERAGAQVDVPDLAAGDFERLTVTGQLEVISRVAGAAPLILIGSSLGGYLAALYAARHAEVEKVVLLAPAFAFAERWPDWLGADEMAAWRRDGTRPVFHYGTGRMQHLSYQIMEDAARYEAYPDFSQPALIFHGRHDDAVPVRYSEQFAATHSNARLEILDSGHELLNVLDYIGERVLQFLNAPPSPS